MNIDNFIINKPCNNGYLDFNGLFDELYIKIVPYCIQSKRRRCVIVLASVKAKNPGNGAFKGLISHLIKNFPDFPIVAENILTTRLANGILGMGGKQITFDNTPSFVFNLKEG